MRVLVTGAAGYLGAVVARQLVDAGHSVVGLAHRRPPFEAEGIRWVRGDVLDPASMVEAARGVQAVAHLAALVRVREAFEHPVRYFRVNVTGTLNVLDALPGQARFVLASTASVYGAPARQPITEDTALEPGNPYADSKLAAERLVAAQAATGRIGAVVLRQFNIAGGVGAHGDLDDSRVITRACAVAAGRIPHLDVYGDGCAVRDFVHVADAARAVVLALDACAPGKHAVFNVGATPANVADIVAATRLVTGREIAVTYRAAHSGEVRELRADTSRIRAALGWHAEHSRLHRLVADQWAAEQASFGQQR